MDYYEVRAVVSSDSPKELMAYRVSNALGLAGLATVSVRAVQIDPCPYDFAHTSAWCGNPMCRES